MNTLHLLGKKVFFDRSELLLQYSPGEDWLDYWTPKNGHWECRDGWLIGTEPGNFGGILFSKERFEEDVMFSFTVKAALPATRDLNAVFCANWDDETDYLGESYVCGLNGWYEHKSGIERNGSSNLYSTTSLYHYQPGTEVRMTAGAINGHSFMVVDDVLITELVDPQPIRGGHVGFSAYCTKLMIKDIEIRKIAWEDFPQLYEPEF
ncbi:MAG: hypothetical protein IJ518_05590 [Clostridia bacterium]|nr:hypothetical protein [Clostridia bacterium]